jgi:hypothetical protein
VDCRTALARGLAEYLSTAAVNFGQRDLTFVSWVIQWGAANEPAKLPALCVVGSQDMQTEDPNFVPIVHHLGDGVCLRETDSVSQDFDVMLWTTDPVSRMGLTAAVEDMLSPTDWMSGFRLKLPYYFGMEAAYLCGSMRHDDASETVASSRYVATFSVHVEGIRLAPMPLQPLVDARFDLTMDGRPQSR